MPRAVRMYRYGEAPKKKRKSRLKTDTASAETVRAALDLMNSYAGFGNIYACHWDEKNNLLLHSHDRMRGFKYPKKHREFDVKMVFDKKKAKKK